MTKGVNYPVLRAGDLVFTGGKKPFDYITRWVTKDFKNRRNYEVATHVGMLVNFWGQLFIAEMVGRSGWLEINPLSKYLNKRRKFIIDIKRTPVLQHMPFLKATMSQIALDYRRGLEYDYKGLVEFVMKDIEDDPNKDICSEYMYRLTRPFVKYPEKFDKLVSPADLQEFEDFSSVKNWERI